MSLSCAFNVSFSILYKISFLSSSTPLYSLVQWALSQVSFQFFYFLFSSHFFFTFFARYTCYMQQYNYRPWSYYTGSTNPGVIAEVFTSPYSIGYSVLTDASASTLPMASLINKASNIVVPTSSSVAYAIMDQGGNLDANFNAVVRHSILSTYYITTQQ